MKSSVTHRPKGTKSVLEKILGSMLTTEDIASKERGISATTLLQKLDSENISQGMKLIFLALLIAAIMDKMKLSDFASLFDKMFSKPGTGGQRNGDLREQTKLFVTKYKINEDDLLLIVELLKGTALKEFPDKLGISKSNANKKIRSLWQRLGLGNREQLMFVAGWMRIICPDIGCLNAEAE